MSAPKNPPAFPREDYQCDDAPGQRGMSLRDYFAGQAMIGLNLKDPWGASDIQARLAYDKADAMLAERSGEEGE